MENNTINIDAAASTPNWPGNPAVTTAEVLTIADILGSQVDATTGSISYTLGNAITGEVCTTNAMAFNAAGMTSIPVGPGAVATNGNVTPGNTSAVGAQAVCYVRNDQWIVMNIRDTRTQSRAGNPSPGDSVLVSQNGQAVVSVKGNGAVTLSTTTDGYNSGSNMLFTISPTTNGGQLSFVAPFGKIVFDSSGFHVSTSSGARLDIGGVAAPGPLATIVGSSINMSAGNVNINPQGGTINLGLAPCLPALYGIIPVVAPAIPILGEGVGAVVVNASASTSVLISTGV